MVLFYVLFGFGFVWGLTDGDENVGCVWAILFFLFWPVLLGIGVGMSIQNPARPERKKAKPEV